jgi:tetratricopeptide (TPR) repeat protein
MTLLALIGAVALGQNAPVTFARDVAPIVYAHCAECHHAGGPAPFSLTSYDEVRQRAKQIVAVTKRRYMPPWKVEPGPDGADQFVGQQPLSSRDIETLQRWVDDGAAEGDRSSAPAPPRFNEGWQLGAPDLVVSPPAYTLPAGGTDVFRIFAVPLRVDRERFVRAMEFRPGSPSVIHHANIRIDTSGSSRALDDADPAAGYEGLLSRSAVYPDGHFLGWTPGQLARALPKGLAWRLEPNTDLVVELHMQPTGKAEKVQPSIGFYFTDDPPERTPAMLRLGRQNIDIPAGASQYVVEDSIVLPVDVDVQAVQPHAHYLARDVRGTATLPDGTTRPLVVIKDWDFRWQQVYRYVVPVRLPRGTTVSMRYTYDNSDANPRNTRRPPIRVQWGQRSSDEMGDLWIQVQPRDDRDLAVLERAFTEKMTAEDLVGTEARLRRDPNDAALHDDAAMLYLQSGKASAAVEHFRASLRLQPQSAAAHFNLGTALNVEGRLDEAAVEYRDALARRADYPQAHNNLGVLLLQRRRFDEALTHFREAARISPDWPQALTNLASLLAAAPSDAMRDPETAVRCAERAVALTGRQDPNALDVRASALASSGAFDGAVEAADAALALKPPPLLAAAIRERRDLYVKGQFYRLR